MNKTVFVVGAGASKELKFPLGTELKGQIAQSLRFKIDFGRVVDAVQEISMGYEIMAHRTGTRDINPYIKAGRRIAEVMPQAISIDNFLDIASGDKIIEQCGKLAIAYCILKAERESTLYSDQRQGKKVNFSTLSDVWLTSFFQLLTENCPLSALPERLGSVCFVVFNYDRAIEQYLHAALQNYYGIDSEKAAGLLSNLQIYHPYGSVGQLSWQWTGGMDYGEMPHPELLLALSENIRTFTEQIDENSKELQAARKSIRECERLVFLGFAYHDQNVDLIMPNNSEVTSKHVYGTSFGLSVSNSIEIKDLLSEKLNSKNINLKSVTSANLFAEYWKSLTFARRIRPA